MSDDWWRETTVYQVYPRSFCDSNGDGIGDLPGAISKLDVLRDLGVQTLWFSPFYPSPQRDFGYDITDHCGVAPEYGTPDDARRLFDAIHDRGMRVVVDIVLNHTSDEHPWFRESRSGRKSPRRDWYLWRPGRRGGPPNNWRSMVGPRGWHHDPVSDEWYWASFLPFQPDVNMRNPAVQQAQLGVVRHWLGAGADGIRLDIFHALFKDAEFPDNPFSWRPLPGDENQDGFFQSYRHNVHHPATIAFARTLRAVADEFSNPSRFLVGEAFGPPATLRAYCGEGRGLHLIFLFKTLGAQFRADKLRALLAEFEREFPAPLVPTWAFSNHDRPRSSTRLGGDPLRDKLRAALQLTVRGVPFLYYGEELGMVDHEHLPLATALDPVATGYRWVPGPVDRWLHHRGMMLNRDRCRTPMQWSAAPNAGFSTSVPWLPVNPNHATVNVEAQRADPDSVWHCHRRLLALRSARPALRRGSLALAEGLPRAVLGYARVADADRLEVRLNCEATPVEIAAPGNLVFSTRESAGRVSPDGRYTLGPHEGTVFDPGSP